MRRTRQTVIGLSVLAMLPLFFILLTALFGGLMGCEVNEGGAQPCVIGGMDFGGFLSGMLTMGWFGLLTIPFLMAVLGLWGLAEAGSRWRRRRKERRAAGA